MRADRRERRPRRANTDDMVAIHRRVGGGAPFAASFFFSRDSQDQTYRNTLRPPSASTCMNPWASPWEADADDAAPVPLPRSDSPPLEVGALPSLDVDPWSGQPIVPAPPTSDDANLASLTSASMMIDENVWNESTETGAREDAKEAVTERVDEASEDVAEESPSAPTPTRAEEPSEDVAEESPSAPTPTRAKEPSKHVSESVDERPSEREVAQEHTNTPSEPAPSSVRSAFSRLGTRVAEWRQARAAAQEEARKQAEAEQSKGWRRVAPASTNTSSKLGSWLKRAPPPPKDTSLKPPSSSTTLNADDLAWLDAATSKKEAAASPASDTAPAAHQDTGGRLVPGLGPMTLSARTYNPLDHDDEHEDDDEFGEIQTYTDGPAPLYDAPISTRPAPYVDRGGGEQGGALASHTETTYRDTPEKAPLALWPPSPPPQPPKAREHRSSPPRKGGLSRADLDFFENL